MPKNRKIESLDLTSNSNPTSSPILMRTLALIGICFFIAGIFLFTRGPAWHFGYMSSGILVGLLGLLILGLTAGNPDAETPARSPRSKSRPRRRPTAELRSLRVRRMPAGGGR
jgi:hypothetical protein